MSKRYLPVTALIVTVFIWGTTFVATKVALADVQPLALALLRFVLGSAVLLPLAWSTRRRTCGPMPWSGLALAGLFGGCLFFALQNVGLVYTTAAKGSLILASVPALIALLSVLILRERLAPARIAGVAASILGVAVIVLAGTGDAWAAGSGLGDVLIAGSAVSWALYTVLTKGLVDRLGPAVVSAASVGFGALFLIPFAGYEALTQPLPTLTLSGLAAIAYLGIIGSAGPFLLWNYALSQVDASEAAVYINVVPVVAVISAVVLLHETVAPVQLAGGALVMIGVWAADKEQAPAPKPEIS